MVVKGAPGYGHLQPMLEELQKGDEERYLHRGRPADKKQHREVRATPTHPGPAPTPMGMIPPPQR